MSLFRPAFAVLGLILVILALLMLLPLALLVVDDAPDSGAFLVSSAITGITGLLLYFFNRGTLRHLTTRKVFMITATNWIGTSAFASIPFHLSQLRLSVTNAFFESVSGITTTGSTVLQGLDSLPRDILLWRSITQWLGGIGIVAMAVMILPFLRVGGMRLFKTESSDWSDKATPQIRVQLQYLVMVYLILTIMCLSYYWAFGMSLFEAVNHAMTTVSTGGYSTHDSSIGFYQSRPILWGSVLFMALSGIPFTLYVHFLISRRFSLVADAQVKFYFQLLCIAGVAMGLYLYFTAPMNLMTALLHGFLNTTSIMTTTGYVSTDYGKWGSGAIAMFFFLTFVGGCSGSTSGGIKVFRFQLFWLYLREQFARSVHPNAIITLEYNNRRVTEDVIKSSIAFMYMAMWSYAMITIILGLCGLDLVTSTTGALTALMNVGPGLGDIVGPAGSFQSLPDVAKWVLSFGMLLGRLEYLTLYILLTPMYWRS